MDFKSLNLAPVVLRAVAEKGYEIATPIQADAIPPILAGRDLIGCAQTGTGKTAAFALPTIQRMLASLQRERDAAMKLQAEQSSPARSDARPDSLHGSSSRQSELSPQTDAQRRRSKQREPMGKPRAPRRTRTLALAPTRELVAQIATSFAAYGKHTALRHATIYGGVGQGPQVKSLQHGVDAIIATPGRLLDLMNQGYVDLSRVEILILDEADQMLDMGFIPDLRRIIANVPQERQTLMFSATMPAAIRELAHEWLKFPVSVQTAPVAAPADRIEQSVYFVAKEGKIRLLEQWLQNTASSRTIVFARTKHGADKIVKYLCRSKIRAAAIHGDKSQNFRERTLEQFKSSRPPVLVATDIAARGLDIKEVSHVVNYDLPETPETYVHRIGRTGRAGATGSAVSFCSAEEVKYLRGIERLTRRRIDVGVGHGEYTLGAPPAPVDEPCRQGGRRGGRPRANGGRHATGDRPETTGGRRRPAAAGRFATGRPRKRIHDAVSGSESTILDVPAPTDNVSSANGTARRPKRRKRAASRQ